MMLVLAFSLPARAEKGVPATPSQAAVPMLPYLEWMLDSTGKLGVEDVARAESQSLFRPLNLKKLPEESGTVWLRFTLAGRPAEVRPATLLLDMGEGVPGTPTLYVSRHNVITGATEWQSFTPSQRSIFLMPEARNEPQTAYIRMDGLPGLWFAPTLRSPHNAATALERLVRPAAIVALAVVMLLCLLRGLTERGEWRIWTSAYTGAALCNAIWGIPATGQGHVPMLYAAAVLAPGVALMLLPHVGRHLMRTRQLSRSIDIQFLLLALPGALLALLPLLPGFSWTTRLLDLWPAGVLILLPTTLGAWLTGLPGARRFLLGCLLPPLGVAVAWFGMGSELPAPLLATAPLWGVALGALIIAGTAAPREYADMPGADAREGGEGRPAPTQEQDLLDGDPNLRIVSREEMHGEGMGDAMVFDPAGSPRMDSRVLALEEQLRVPLDSLLRDGTALDQCSLPPAARQLCDAMLATVRDMTSALAAPLRGAPSGHGAAEAAPCVFDLQELLRQAHDAVSAVADSKNIALSWFMPPHLPQRYRGEAGQILHVLQMLLESAVRATSRGAVQLSVRRVPESVDPGHLLFSVTDTGAGVPPEERSSLSLVRAWELAGAHRGFLGLESSPHGASISFTLRLEAATADMLDNRGDTSTVLAPGIILAEDSPGNRQLLAFFLEGLPYQTREARSADEAAELQERQPARLLIFDAEMPGLTEAVGRIRAAERAQGLPAAMLMALSSDDGQWEQLREAGFTHALPKPVTRAGLRATVCELLPQEGAALADTPDAPQPHTPPLPTLPLAGEEPAPPAQAHGSDLSGSLRLSDLAGPLTLRQDDDDEEIIDTGLPLPQVEPHEPLRMTPGGSEDAPPAAPNALILAPFGPKDAPAETDRPGTDRPGRADRSDAFLDAAPLTGLSVAARASVEKMWLDAPLSMTPPPAKGTLSSTKAEMPDLPEPAPQSEEHAAAQPPVEQGPENGPKPEAPQSMLPPQVSAEPLPLPDIFPSDVAQRLRQPETLDAAPPPQEEAPAPKADKTNAAYLTSLLLGPDMPTAGPAASAAQPVQQPPQTPQEPPLLPAAPAAAPPQAPQEPQPLTMGPVHSLPGDDVEWVGEPMPVGSPAPVAAVPAREIAAAAPTPSRTPFGMFKADHSMEWVGEPMPIPKAAPQPEPLRMAQPEPLPQPESRVVPPTMPQQPEPLRILQPESVPQPESPPPLRAEEEPFVPLSFGPPSSPPTMADNRAERPRPTLLPQSAPLLDFIIADGPTVPAAPGAPASGEQTVASRTGASAPSAAPAPSGAFVPAAPAASAAGATGGGPAAASPLASPVAAPAPRFHHEQAARPAAMPAQPAYSNIGEPRPVTRAPAAAPPDTPLENLLADFDHTALRARQAFQAGDTDAVQNAARHIAFQAESFGLRALARMARCVEDAAKARDREALGNLLPELELFVERNRIAMRGR